MRLNSMAAMTQPLVLWALAAAKYCALQRLTKAAQLMFLNFAHGWRLLVLVGAFAVGAYPAHAQVPKLYEGADLALGAKLIADNQCAACHQKRVGGDGSSIYDPRGRISTLGALRGMVEACNMQLNLGLFPDEVNSVAAVLNRDHYRLK